MEILHLQIWGRSRVTRRFELHSNSRGADEIKGLPISIDFYHRNTELLLLFSIISPWIHWIIFAVIYVYIIRTSYFILTFFTCCCYFWVMLLLFATFFSLRLLSVANINNCTFSFDVSSKFGLRFTIAIIPLGSMSLNLVNVSFPMLFVSLGVFLWYYTIA